MIVLYHHPTRQQQAVVKATELREREEALAEEKKKLGMTD
jgi:pre-mRNA branch site protein p14